MFIDKIKASFTVDAALNSEDSGVQGSVNTTIGQDLTYLGLDAFYSFCVDGEDLATMLIDDFPSVELNAVALDGDDKQPLLINSIHGYAIKIIPDAGLVATGTVNIAIKDIGSAAGGVGAVHYLVPGDSLVVMTDKGWPPLATSQIEITEDATLTNCKVAFCLFGHSTATALGYGS